MIDSAVGTIFKQFGGMILTTCLLLSGCNLTQKAVVTSPTISNIFFHNQKDTAVFPFLTVQELVAPLASALSEAILLENHTRLDRGTTLALSKTLNVVEEIIDEKSCFVIGDIYSELRQIQTNGDSRIEKVMVAFNSLPGIYKLSSFDIDKPTIFLIHGAGQSLLEGFDLEFYKEEYNIVGFYYNHWASLDEIVDIFNQEWILFKQQLLEDRKLIVKGFSYGNILFRAAVLKQGGIAYENVYFEQIAPPLGGARQGGPLLFTPRLGREYLCTVFVKDLHENISVTLMPNSNKMKELFNEKASLRFESLIAEMVTILIAHDPINPDPVVDSDRMFNRGEWFEYMDLFDNGRGKYFKTFHVDGSNTHRVAAKLPETNDFSRTLYKKWLGNESIEGLFDTQ